MRDFTDIFTANEPLLYSQFLELFNEVRFEVSKVETIYFVHLNFIGSLAPAFILCFM